MPKLNRDGLPVDPLDWTCEDWQTLFEMTEKAKQIIAKRHKEKANAMAVEVVPVGQRSIRVSQERHGVAADCLS